MNCKNLLALSVIVIMLAACSGDQPQPTTDTSSDAQNASLSGQAASAASGAAAVDAERLVNAHNEPEQWMTYGGTYDEKRHSTLDQITTDNVGQLGLAWFADLNTNRGQQSTPLVIDGVIYVTEAWSKVNAFDARTGELLWHFDPEVPGEWGGKGCCDVVNRGAAAWNGKIYVSTYDGRVVAIDAETGEQVWETVHVDQTRNYSSTGAPRVANGKVFIGTAGAEYNFRGWVSALDAETGELVWRFYTVPGNPELGFENDTMAMAAETWTGEWWEYGGGGSTWDSMTYNPETNMLYFGVGNGSPWNPLVRSPDGGDNLFTISIVAVDADTGEYLWHYQQIPWEEWDYDAVQQLVVADLEVDDQERKVLMQTTKSGYYYMVDAWTGELIRANNFVPVNWTSGYDMETGRPIINEAAQYTKRDTATIIQPGPQGAKNWHPMSYNPDTGLLYIPAQENSMAFTNAPDAMVGAFALGVNWTGGEHAYDDPDNTIPQESRTRLVAWDPIAAEEVWAIEDIPSGGTLTTAGGLLFKGNGGAQQFAAYDATNGELLWSADTQATAAAGAVTYMLDGEQYLAHVVGGSVQGGYYAPTYSRLLVYKLGGDATLPPKVEFTQRPFAPPEETASADVVAAGQVAYGESCAMCHGDGGTNRGMFPDLRRSPLLHSQEGFDAVVLDGLLSGNGMVSFADQVSPEESAAIRHFLISRAHQAMNAPAFGFGPPPAPEPEDVDTHSND